MTVDGRPAGELAPGEALDVRFVGDAALLAQLPGGDVLPPAAREVRPTGVLRRSSARTLLRARRHRRADDHGPDQRRQLLDPSVLDLLDGEGEACSAASVSRLQWQPSATKRQGRHSRSCQPASRASSARTCSRKSRRPPGRSTRAASPIAAVASGTVQSTSVETTVSKRSSSNGGARPAPPRPPAPDRPRRRSCAGAGPCARRARRGRTQDGQRVVRQVQARSGADLQGRAARPGEQGSAMSASPAFSASRRERS